MNIISGCIRFSLIGMAIVTLSACSSAYYSAMEKVGIHKRDIFIDRVEEAKDSQQQTKEQFRSALDKFASVVTIEPSELQRVYEELQDEYDACEAQAEDVKKRIDAVEDVAVALFEEWEAELDQYTNQNLRRDVEKKLRTTKVQYKQMIKAMRKAEKKVYPVLAALKDQVLYLKHNLNARAISTLKNELSSVRSDVNALIKDMEVSINRSQQFIKDFKDAN